MKQINDLIVLSVPKDEKYNWNIKLDNVLFSNSSSYKRLPPGQYEIIGLYGEVGRGLYIRSEVMEASGEEHNNLSDFVRHHNLTPTETSTLLFIHKLK